MSESQKYVQQCACYFALALLVHPKDIEHPFLLMADPEQNMKTEKDWVVSLLLSLKMGMSGPGWSAFAIVPARF